ncbi:MAG: hypothetical protein IKC70_00335 [Bacteroidaceae bacterium]|nr:hypothetical protein [Bacteroidaceae bacterium]
MKNTFLYFIFLSLFIFAATGCSKDEEDYNADTAPSYYKPLEYEKMVASIAITSTVDKKDYSWTYNFVYDAQNRIKEINGTSKFYENKIKQFCEGTIQTNYYYNNETLKIEYVYDIYVPRTGESKNIQGKYYGCFDKEDGKLIQFDAFDCEYEGLMLSKVYTDYGTSFGLEYDRNNNIIKTYQFDSIGYKPVEKTIQTYKYSFYKNKTNIDFASFLGYNIAERITACNTLHPYELFHLGAFEMLGARGTYLPEGEWEFDAEGCPIKYVSPKNRTYIITYKE